MNSHSHGHHGGTPSVPQFEGGTDRLHGLDALRGFALLLGVLLHATMSYLPGSEYYWLTSETEQSVGAALIFFVIHNFRMLTFFVLAGFFARLLFHRRGVSGFAKNRWKRIAAPLLIFWPIVLVALTIVLVWSAMIKHGGTLPKESPPGPAFTPDDFPLTHLWFLYMLCLLYVIGVGLRTAIAGLDKTGWLRNKIDAVFDLLMSWWAPLLLAIPLALSLPVEPQWYRWFGVPTPDRSLYPALSTWLAFGSAFTVGWLLQRQISLLQRLQQRWPFYLLVAVAGSATCLAMTGLSPELVPAKPELLSYGYALCYAVAAWSWAFALIGLCLRFLSGASPRRRYLADASYWIYIVHLPVIVALQIVATQVNWPWWLELSLILLSGTVLLLASYQLLVRHTVIGALLNGRKVPRNNGKAAMATSQHATATQD